MLAVIRFASLARYPWLVCAVSPPADELGRPFDLRWRGTDGGDGPANRRRFVHALALDADRLIVPQQTHSAKVAVVTASTPTAPGALAETDGVCTADCGIPLLVLSADCGMSVVVDPAHRAVGVAHSGWRGIALGVLGQLVSAMVSTYGTNPSACVAAIAPCASSRAYEVGDDVLAALALHPGLAAATRPHPDSAKRYLDLATLIACQLESAGIPASAIERDGRCTITDPGGFASHRRDGPAAGRFGLLAAIIDTQ